MSCFSNLKKGKKFNVEKAPDFIMERFSNLLNSYSKAYNKMYNRKGGLFMDYLKRVEVITDDQFGATVFSIHKNPVDHNYSKTVMDWYWSSYKILLSSRPTDLMRKEVMDFFGGKDQFVKYHQQEILLKDNLFEE